MATEEKPINVVGMHCPSCVSDSDLAEAVKEAGFKVE